MSQIDSLILKLQKMIDNCLLFHEHLLLSMHKFQVYSDIYLTYLPTQFLCVRGNINIFKSSLTLFSLLSRVSRTTIRYTAVFQKNF